jgi:hypothetical protein
MNCSKLSMEKITAIIVGSKSGEGAFQVSTRLTTQSQIVFVENAETKFGKSSSYCTLTADQKL